jgi:hypothetical protein
LSPAEPAEFYKRMKPQMTLIFRQDDWMGFTAFLQKAGG